MFCGLLLLHWLSRNPRASFSTNEFINLPEKTIDERFYFRKESDATDSLKKIFINYATAPTIIPAITSKIFYNEYEEIANNKFQKYIFEGKYKEKWGNSLYNP